MLRYSRIVSLSEIEKNDFNLNISRYVSTAEKDAIVDLADVKKNLHSIRKVDINEAKTKHNQFLSEFGLPKLL